MSSGGVVIQFPRRRSPAARLRARITDVLGEVVTFERALARLAWSVTLVGVIIGFALQSI